MGFINFQKDKDLLRRIKSALKRRGLSMKREDDWEVHGPHAPEMNYQVLIGPAYKSGKWRCFAIIYPWAVYEASGYDEWSDVTAENRIPCV